VSQLGRPVVAHAHLDRECAQLGIENVQFHHPLRHIGASLSGWVVG
jgi:hypothetical protein